MATKNQLSHYSVYFRSKMWLHLLVAKISATESFRSIMPKMVPALENELTEVSQHLFFRKVKMASL